jgi:hypothetical protein
MNQTEMTPVNEISMSDRVKKAIQATIRLEPVYFRDTLRQRSEPEGGIGSVYPLKSELIESQLHSNVWTEYEHPNVLAGCTAAKTKLPGKLGVVSLSDVSTTTTFILVDPKKTGFCEILVEGNVPRRDVDFTVAIMGKHESGEEIVYTFHPGAPIPPSRMEGLVVGETLTWSKAVELGFRFAKVA